MKNHASVERIQKEFASLVDLILSLHQRKLELVPTQVALSMHPASFLRQFCTVIVDIGRVAGKTHYISTRAQPGDIVISLNAQSCRHFQENTRDLQLTVISSLVVENESDVFYLMRDINCRTIWIDEGWAIKNWSSFYECAAQTRAQRIVIFGSR